MFSLGHRSVLRPPSPFSLSHPASRKADNETSRVLTGRGYEETDIVFYLFLYFVLALETLKRLKRSPFPLSGSQPQKAYHALHTEVGQAGLTWTVWAGVLSSEVTATVVVLIVLWFVVVFLDVTTTIQPK